MIAMLGCATGVVKVVESIHTGPFARWMHRKKWGAVTLPSLTGIRIRYWVVRDDEVARHEWTVHVEQIRRMGKWNYLKTYVTLWLRAYKSFRMSGYNRKYAVRLAYETHPMEKE